MANIVLTLELVQAQKELLYAEVIQSQMTRLDCERKSHMDEPTWKGIAIITSQAEIEWHEEYLRQNHLCFKASPHKVKLMVALGWRIKRQAEICASFR
jgi:hypothetical protein